MTNSQIQLAHGGGGRLTRELIDTEIVSRFGDGPLKGLPDGALLPINTDQIVFTTDSFVVQPIEFPGGNIGSLAIHGTVNDIAVSGGRPKWLSLAMILEEGLPLDTLRRVLDEARDAAKACGVQIATGDTKVVSRGQCDGIYMNTAGIGEKLPEFSLSPDSIRNGDRILVNGCLGDHGLAVMAARETIHIQGGPESDSAPVHTLVQAALPYADQVRFMRDPTRGGAAAVLNELVENRDFGMTLHENDVPFSRGASGICEMLGLDPLHVASEGRLIAICSADVADDILAAWRKDPHGTGSACIGEVTSESGRVIMETITGGKRLVDLPRGELLPRIC
ncbi:MAG: hydrogenase expression/formation protein HypE [Verrucomicrobia bacterium]|jgi:hydrogenase expression/formation protein HypE|nr:hydrogenase expression/formation protein HypE [Verrucomicrobiota bacterium]